MDRNKNYRFNQQDKKIVDIFTDLGMPRNLAKTLMYISQANECRSAEVEQGAALRQPEVSVAMQELLKRGWVEKRDMKKKGKGRPVHIYKLTSSLDDIVNTFELEKMREINTVKKELSELKNLIRDIEK
jgi:predicted transcriptional regulator